MQYVTAVYWNRGSVAACNQDSLTLQQVLTGRGRVLMAAVCDGMGGLQQGETASGYMTERLQEWFYGSLMRSIHKKKPYWMIRRSLDRMVYHVQEQMRQYAGRERLDMGTTVSVLVLWEDIYLIWHLGDSRIYRIRSKGRFNRESYKQSSKLTNREKRNTLRAVCPKVAFKARPSRFRISCQVATNNTKKSPKSAVSQSGATNNNGKTNSKAIRPFTK